MSAREKMFDTLDAIRARPESHRWVLVTIISIIFSAGIIGFWIWNLHNELSILNADNAANRDSKGGEAASLLSPWSSVKESWNAFKASIQ